MFLRLLLSVILMQLILRAPEAVEVTLSDNESPQEAPQDLKEEVIRHLSDGNTTAAIDYLQQFLEKDDPEAHYLIGKILVRYGTSEVFEDGLKHLRIAAQKLIPGAFFELGGLYTNGRGVAKDLTQAAAYYKLAAEMGNGEGQFNYAVVLMKGEGVDQDLRGAYHYFSLAAENKKDLDDMTEEAAIYRDRIAVALFPSNDNDAPNADAMTDLITFIEQAETH